MASHPRSRAVPVVLRERLAAGFLHAYLAGRQLPPYLPGEPGGMAALAAAPEMAPEFLDFLAEIYGVTEWTEASFREAFLQGALGTWRPGSRVQEVPGGVRVLSSVCPIGAEVERDPRACQLCRAFQEAVARRALGDRLLDVHFGRLMKDGDGACDTVYEMRPDPPRARRPREAAP